MKRLSLAALAVFLLALPSPAFASVEADLAAATAAGHSVFLVVTEPNAAGIDLARRVTSEAQQVVPDVSIVEMDRTDAANAAVVKRYRLESVPVPLILVVASNGVAAGGARPHLVTANRLAAMVPSPAKASHMKALDEKKASFLVLSREAMTDRAAATKAAADAVTALKGAAVVTSVDLDSEKEAAFVAELKADAKTKVPLVVVFNAKGQATGTFAGVPKVADLVAAATKEIQSCCPGGGPCK